MYNKAKLAHKTHDGAKDIIKTYPKHWARSFFEVGVKCESMDNNLCESFNHAIIDDRFYPIVSMLERIRVKVLVRIQEQRGKGCKDARYYLPINIQEAQSQHQNDSVLRSYVEWEGWI
jgi:hypothetical protein